jgi:RHS repeat-associated protein
VDANGNTTGLAEAGVTSVLGYDDRNRLGTVQQGQDTVASYTYNALGQRVRKIAGSLNERYDYDEGRRLVAEYGATNRDYIWLDDVPVAVVDAGGGTATVSYVTADQLGTPRAISDADGTTKWSWPYAGNAWGEQEPTSNGYVFNLRFPGQYADAESGLNYNVHRDYDSATGRYVESDPLGLFGGQASTYAYADSNPFVTMDPTGLQSLVLCANPANAAACAAAGIGSGSSAAGAGSSAAGAIAGGAALAGAVSLTGDQNKCPKDDCEEIVSKINSLVSLMEDKYDEMLADQHDLYNKAFDTKLPGDAAYWGTWIGHVNRYEGLRKGLQRLIGEAETKGCPVPAKAYQMANTPAPAWPISHDG